MSALENVLAEKGYPSRPKARASPTPSARVPAPFFGPTAPQIITAALPRPTPMPQGRLARGPADGGFGWWMPQDLLGEYGRAEAIRLCRLACQEDSDAAGARRDIISLANPGFSWVFTGSDRAKRLAEREVEDLGKRLGDFRDWDALINHQLGECFEAGASSLEAYPTKSRRAVAGVEVVPAEEIVILRQGNERVYTQQLYGVQLDPRTYRYGAFDLRGRDPYGTPAMLSALAELGRKVQLLHGADKIMRLIADGAFLQLGIPKPKPAELGVPTESHPEYADRLRAWYESYVQIAIQAREYGVMVTEAEVDAKAIPVTGNVQGVSQLAELNNMRLWSGLMTLPFLRGKMDSTTQALAEVVYPIMLSHAVNIQAVTAPQVEFIANLHLQLAGIAASVRLDFAAPPNPFTESHAKAAQAQAAADTAYTEMLGDEYVTKVAVREDLDPEKVLAWRKAAKAAAPAPALPPDSTPPGGDPNGQQQA